MVHRFAPMIAMTAIVLPLTLFACTIDSQSGTNRDPIPAARVTGPARSCIPLSQVRESRVRDDRTIDFITGGRSAYRTVLPYSCPGLRLNNAFSYSTSLSQLCGTDIIHVLQTSGGLHRGAGCGLGEFVPVELTTR